MTDPQEIVYLSSPECVASQEDEMRFRLTYDGPLYAKQRDPQGGQPDPKAPHIHDIRRHFHQQLKRHWNTNKFLLETVVWRKDFGALSRAPDGISYISPDPSQREPLVDVVADLYQENGYRFVPLIREDWDVQCELDILFLRRDMPGSIVHAGDIDNRIKVLLDALRKPHNANELRENTSPRKGENPFFVLLEDDKLISGLRVETDRMLWATDDNDKDQTKVKLIISVKVRPFRSTMFNLGFV